METTCCFTGHRVIPEGTYYDLESRLEKTLRTLIESGVRYFGAGGALGFDTLAAETVLRLRYEYPFIKLILVLPFADQAAGWSVYDRDRYEDILRRADKVVYVGRDYTPYCFSLRNRRLVDHSQVCVCYFTGEKGGTAATVAYAQKKGLRVVNIA